MSERPRVVLAYSPILCGELFTAHQRERLLTLAEVLRFEPLEKFDEDEADALLGRAEVLFTGWGCAAIEAGVLERAPQLRAVIHAAGTLKSHITPDCFDRELAISSAAAANAVPVAQYTLGAILLANKRAFQLSRRYGEVRRFRLWAADHPRIGNHRKRIGLVGASHIGRRVLTLLTPFDFEVRLHDPTRSDDSIRALGAEPAGLDELLAWSDVVSLHAPLVDATRGMLDARRLALLRDGSVLINTARGALIDTESLEREVVSGRIFAVIDTTDPELLPEQSPLYESPNVFLTPHIAGAMGTETERLVDCALDELDRWARGEPLAHAVQRQQWDLIA